MFLEILRDWCCSDSDYLLSFLDCFQNVVDSALMLSRSVYALFVKKVVRKRFVMNLHGLKIKQ